MPALQDHLDTAVENYQVSIYLLDHQRSLSWATAVAFYSGLHLVEAAFAKDGVHCENHGVRNDRLKCERSYQQIWRHYKILYDHSLKARYLTSGSGSAEKLMEQSLGDEGVRQRLIGHHLRQVEKSVARKIDRKEIFTQPAPDSGRPDAT